MCLRSNDRGTGGPCSTSPVQSFKFQVQSWEAAQQHRPTGGGSTGSLLFAVRKENYFYDMGECDSGVTFGGNGRTFAGNRA
jgi:hypothetical protein